MGQKGCSKVNKGWVKVVVSKCVTQGIKEGVSKSVSTAGGM